MRNTDIGQVNDGWHKIILKYTQPDMRTSIRQILNSFLPYLLLCFLMFRSLEYSYMYTLLLSVLAGGFLIRMFIIFHDCGHGSFFKSKQANKVVGMIMGIFAFTPYNKWHDLHREHHATTGNLDKRGAGDIWTMTVNEYRDASRGKRFFYRAFRHPLILFTVGPVAMVILNRLTRTNMSPEAKRNVYFTNIAILAMSVLISVVIGVKAFLLIQLPVLFFSHAAGIWLFYIQHQFEGVTWERTDTWDYRNAAIEGSSFLKLPAVLQWFSGNIGFHHVHHLSSKIPNYNLERCHYETDFFKDVKPVLLKDTFNALFLNLWDENNHRLIRFSEIASIPVNIVPKKLAIYPGQL